MTTGRKQGWPRCCPNVNNLYVLKAENVIEGNMLAGNCTELAFADAENLVTLGQNKVQFVIYHYNVILSHPLESGVQDTVSKSVSELR